MALNNEFKVKDNLNTLGQILSSGVDIADIFAPSNTSWTLTAGNEKFDISGTETLTFQGNNGVDVQAIAATETVIISGTNATNTARGVASFNSDDFTVTDGAVTIKTGGVDNDQLKTATTENSANYVVIRDAQGGFEAGTVTVTGNVSATGHVYAPTIIDSGGDSTEWNHAYNVATTYEQASAGYALSGYNTTLSDSVTSVEVGGAAPLPASEWKQKTLIQALDTILFPDLAPEYSIPTISIGGTTTTQVEVGTIISPLFTGTFTKNDAGILTSLSFQRNSGSGFTTLSTATSPASSSVAPIQDQFGYPDPNNPNARYIITYTDTSYSVIEGSTSWRVNGAYLSGLPKQNNKGVVDTRTPLVRSKDAPQLNSSSFPSNNYTVTGRRKLFYSNDSETAAPTDSAAVRNLPGVIGSGGTWPANNTSFNIAISPGTKRIVIAYPTSFGAISEIKNGIGFDVIEDFSQTTVSVNGANGLFPTNYYVYTYIAGVPFDSPEVYSVIV